MAGVTKVDSELLQWDDSKTAILSKLGQLIQYFQIGAPEVDGVPDYYIDPSIILPVLDGVDVPDDLPDTILNQAKVKIDMEDGLPVVEGIPYWERLDGEPVPYYKLFKEYRDMKYLNSENRLSRSIAKLAESTQMTGKQLNCLAKTYHWSTRCIAFDQYKAKEKVAMRQQAVENLEIKHSRISDELLDQAVDYIMKHPEQLSPKVAIDLAKLAIETGRLSVGLEPNKASSGTSKGGSKTDINIINQNANGSEGGVSQTNIRTDVQKKADENAQDISNLQSILHVLNASGAFAEASGQNVDDGIDRDAAGNKIDKDGNIITDVDFTAE